MEDALISPESFSVLSGAGLLSASYDAPAYVHTTSQVEVKAENTIVLPDIACWDKYDRTDEYYKEGAEIFVMAMKDGEIAAEPCIPAKVEKDHKTLTCYSHAGVLEVGDVVLVDYYVRRTGNTDLIEITPESFGGNFYLEASTLFRDENTGKDYPAEFVIPNCKVQSNFTFSMASSGDPSTFTFTLDAFPDYTKFDRTKKVLSQIQVIRDESDVSEDTRAVCTPNNEEDIALQTPDSAVSITYDNDSTKDAVKITMSGLDVESHRNEATFSVDPGVHAIQVNFKLPIKAKSKYRVKHYNPVFKQFYDMGGHEAEKITDENGQYVKDQTITSEQFATDPANTLEVLVSELRGPISIAVFELPETGSSSTLVRTIDIDNRVFFKQDEE